MKYNAASPFDQEFFLILNLMTGGNLGGAVDPNFTESSFEIEYVRVYQYDYATIDEENPSTPEKLQIAQLRNTIFWNASIDDYGVEKYAIYVDNELYDYASLNQYTFTRLDVGKSYQIQVQAIDFLGNASGKSNILSLTIV